MKYQHAGATDLAVDEFFIQWVKAPTAASNLFWQNWLQEHPEKYEVVQEARELVRLLSEEELEEEEKEDINAVWQHLQQAIREEKRDGEEAASVVPLSFWLNRHMLVAASVGMLLLLASFFLFGLLRPRAVTYATAYGERRTILLPDSSVVVLHANSTLSYTNSWLGSNGRLVKLKGEAFFSVKHLEDDQKFVVQTTDGTQVEVLGTEFDVKSRGVADRVVLASGKVRLRFSQGDTEKQLTMQPGELVEVAGKAGAVTRKQVRPELYTSWKDGRIIFDNTSLREIALMLEQVYGYQVVIVGAALAEQQLTANLEDRGVHKILDTVSETLGTTVTKTNNTITIRLSNI